MHLLGFIIFASLIIISIAEILKCSDITTRRAIEKRGRQINLKCLENKQQLEKCNNHTAVDIAWNDFEQINEDYFMKSNSCMEEKRKKRHCGCGTHLLNQYHVDNYDHQYFKRKLNGNRMRRNVHGTSDDKNDQQIENDYSKNFQRFKKNECLKNSERERTRLFEKFSKPCKPDTTYDRDKMSMTCKENLSKLSKARHKAYSNYVISFRNCYGPIN
ncbi:hypothetical protein ACH3XW_20520 [Acanthocheilonema viteae]